MFAFRAAIYSYNMHSSTAYEAPDRLSDEEI
jgi:hypothetical protein